MPSAATLKNLIAVKTDLANKYSHYANTAGSLAKRETYRQKSLRYSRQVETIRRLAERKAAAAE